MTYFPSVSCTHSVHRILPISQLYTFCAWNTSHQSAAYILYTEYFPLVNCIRSVHGILPISQLHTFCKQNTSINMYHTEKYFNQNYRDDTEVDPIYKGPNVQMRCHDRTLSIKIRPHITQYCLTSLNEHYSEVFI